MIVDNRDLRFYVHMQCNDVCKNALMTAGILIFLSRAKSLLSENNLFFHLRHHLNCKSYVDFYSKYTKLICRSKDGDVGNLRKSFFGGRG